MKTTLISTAMAVISLISVMRFKQESNERKTFRVVYDLIVKKPGDGSFQLHGRKIRYGHKDGRMKEVFYNPEGKEVRFKLNTFEGGFVGLTERQVLSPTGPFQKPPVETDEILSKVSSGTASILGYKVYVRKTADGLSELWSTPEIPNTPLKTVFYFRGLPGYTLHEAVAIYWENIEDDVFKKPNWPIEMFYLEDQIKTYEYNKRDASDFKRELEKWKSKQ